jgi:rod shape-determining protein MreB
MQIGSAVPLEEEETFAVKGRNMLNGTPTTVYVSSAEIRDALHECIIQVIGTVRTTLEKTPPELASDIVSAGINMTGGGSLLKRLDDAITQETNLKVHRAASPLTTIIEGLGMILGDFRRYRKLFNLYPT